MRTTLPSSTQQKCFQNISICNSWTSVTTQSPKRRTTEISFLKTLPTWKSQTNSTEKVTKNLKNQTSKMMKKMMMRREFLMMRTMRTIQTKTKSHNHHYSKLLTKVLKALKKNTLRQTAILLKKSRVQQNTINSLREVIEELNKKVDQLVALKNVPLQFNHEKFNYVDKQISNLLNDLSGIEQHGKQYLISIWKKFVEYVNQRDKKVKYFQTKTKIKGNQLASKDKLVNVLQESLKETEGVFLSTQTQLKEFSDFFTNTEKKLQSLAEKNLSQRSEFEQEKILLNDKMKDQNEDESKIEQNIQSYNLVDGKMKQMKRMANETEISYEKCIVEQQKKLMEIYLQLSKAKTDLDMQKAEFEEKEHVIKRMKEEKENWKLECNKLGAKFNVTSQKSEMGMLEMEEYKKKTMCNCCRWQEKSMVLKTCPHAFCKKCIEEMYYSTNRKCYLCGLKFEKSDVHPIFLS